MNNQDFDERMCKTYPLLYRDRHASMRNTCMCFGFSIGPGWHPIVEELSSKLEPLIQKIVDELESKGDPECTCGYPRSKHENGKGKCLEIFQLPIEIPLVQNLLKKIQRWGHFVVSSEIYASKKLKYRLYVAWRKLKYSMSYYVVDKVALFLRFLCDKNWFYQNKPSWCKEYRMEHPAAIQVKEKFGTLRFYINYGTDEMHNLAHEAEAKSAKTCEECGTPGKARGGGWIVTLCDEHAGDKPLEIEEEE